MRRLRRVMTAAALAAVVSVPAVATAQPAPSPAEAQRATQHVTHRGYDVTVPSSWRVVDLRERPTTCVLFDTPTVYVGPAGEVQNCPAHAVGTAPGVWIRPLDSAAPPRDAHVLDKGAATVARPDAGGERHVVIRDAGVVVSTFGGAKAAEVLESARLTPAARRSSAPVRTAEAGAEAVTQARVEVPGTFRGRGFDACSAPSGRVMNAWRQTTNFRSVGVYIGGVHRACAQPNLSADWIRRRVGGGWHPLPIWVGKQAPCTSYAHRISTDPSTARAQGRGAAKAAVDRALNLAIARGSVLYYDMEGYNDGNSRCRRAVLHFLSAWTNQLHRQNFRAGVYSSVSSGIEDLSETYHSDNYARPNHIWAAWWNQERNLDFRPYVPSGQWDNRQRVHQYRGGHNETHGGYTLNIDSNYMSVH